MLHSATLPEIVGDTVNPVISNHESGAVQIPPWEGAILRE